MRKHTKKRCAELIETIEEAHGEIIKFIEKNDTAYATALLGECQDAAIAIGNLIEAQEGEGTEAVKLLEEYCETLYHINEDIRSEQNSNSKSVEKRLKKDIRQIQSAINSLPIRLEAVFMPYNATMWDSLESIWMAADADENCDAYVVPIPYYDRNPDGSFAKCNYDIDKYPDYVPVINHEDFNLAEHCPDMIFIHNPYDEYNLVTTVHPAYYSYRLKEYTDCLVYVPYFTTSGMMSEGQKLLSAYLHADYIVVQSKEMIEQYDKSIPREKFLPLGSPKFDRVIRLCKNPPEPPAEWEEKMKGKRVYFYNTSIGEMLEDTDTFLKKMRYVFETFKEVPDACILWRPHPLLESSFKSMREEYVKKYENLKNSFIEERIGILDTTPDIEVSIAHCDAYLGAGGSSVISLFQMTNKPIYILDKNTTEVPPADWWKGDYYYFPLPDNRRNRYVVLPKNKLFYSARNDGIYSYLCDLPGGNEYSCYYNSIETEGKAYIFPTNAQDILVLSEDRIVDRISLRKQGEIVGSFSHVWIMDDYAFIIPKRYPDLVRMEIKNGRVDYVKDVSSFFWRIGEDESFCGHFVDRKREVFCFFDAKAENVLEIGIKSLEKKIEQVGYGRELESCSAQDIENARYIWLLPREGKTVARWDRETHQLREYNLDVQGLVANRTVNSEIVECNTHYFSGIIPISEERIVFCPNLANMFVELNPRNGETTEWIPPFQIYSGQKNKYFYAWSRGYSVRGNNPNKTWWVNLPERIMYEIDLEKNEAVPIGVEFNKIDICNQYALGFEMRDSKMYSLLESGWNPLRSIISNDTFGKRFDQNISRKSTSYISADQDGECGELTFENLKREIMR